MEPLYKPLSKRRQPSWHSTESEARSDSPSSWTQCRSDSLLAIGRFPVSSGDGRQTTPDNAASTLTPCSEEQVYDSPKDGIREHLQSLKRRRMENTFDTWEANKSAEDSSAQVVKLQRKIEELRERLVKVCDAGKGAIWRLETENDELKHDLRKEQQKGDDLQDRLVENGEKITSLQRHLDKYKETRSEFVGKTLEAIFKCNHSGESDKGAVHEADAVCDALYFVEHRPGDLRFLMLYGLPAEEVLRMHEGGEEDELEVLNKHTTFIHKYGIHHNEYNEAYNKYCSRWYRPTDASSLKSAYEDYVAQHDEVVERLEGSYA